MSPSLTTPRQPSTTSPTLHPFPSSSTSTTSSNMPPSHHHRTPSLGALAQTLESEQEGQVNRLLGMIRQQRAQLESSTTSPTSPTPAASGPDAEARPPSRSASSQSQHNVAVNASTSIDTSSNINTDANTGSFIRPPPPPLLNRTSSSSLSPAASSFSTSTHPLYGTSQTSHTALPPHALRPSTPSRNSSHEISVASREATADDEMTYYRLETANIERENRMLRARIGELEGILAAPGTKTSERGRGR